MAASSIRTLRKKTVPQRPDPRQERVRQIEDYWQQYPGAAPGGTGPTGLLPNDAQGYSRLLNDQVEHENLVNELTGKAPVTVRIGRSPGTAGGGTAGDALDDVAASMQALGFAPPPVQGAPPPSPPSPKAPPAPPVPPPSSAGPGRATRPAAGQAALPSLGALASQTGVSPGNVTRYGNAPGGAVTAEAFLPGDVTDDLPTPQTAAGMLRNMRSRTGT